MDYAPASGTASIQCRDYMAKLLDMRVIGAWLNMTGAEVMEAMILAAGLTPQVDMAGSMVGQFWQIEHKRTSASSHSRFQTAYDLACYLANMSGRDLYANGKVIVCAPYPVASKGIVHTLDYKDMGPDAPLTIGAMNLQFSRDYQIAKGIVVHVTSWDSRQRSLVEYYWSSDGGSTKKAARSRNCRSFTLSGGRLEVVHAFAKTKYDQIVAHERSVAEVIPGRCMLEPRHFMRIVGTGTTWDGTLDVDAVVSSFAWDSGYTQRVTLRTREVARDQV